MVYFPNAKINIGLNIVQKRPDGFHNIETVFYPIPLCDVLEFVEGTGDKGMSLYTSGTELEINLEDNLIHKAYKLLSANYNLPPLQAALHKKIPFGGGLGGGSSDAAFMLKGLNEVFSLGVTKKDLEHYASKLGSDCAFFVRNKPVYAYERGNCFLDIDLKLSNYFLLVTVPNIQISTAGAYGKIIAQPASYSLYNAVKQPVVDWRGTITNDFETVVFRDYPEIESIKNQFYEKGALYASLSGSGSAVYGIFEKKPSVYDIQDRYSSTWLFAPTQS